MTCGIYLLTFGEHIPYVGLSIDIENRYLHHVASLKRGSASKKLQDTFNKYGIPTMYILEECLEKDLLDRERFYIEKYNSIDAGVNSYNGGSMGGINDNNKFSDDNLLMVKRILEVYTNNICTTERIAEYLGISEVRVKSILEGKSFTYLREAYPDLYDKALLLYADKKKPKGYKEYPAIINEAGEIYKIPYRGASKFANEHNLKPPNLSKLLNGGVKTCGGWRLVNPDFHS